MKKIIAVLLALAMLLALASCVHPAQGPGDETAGAEGELRPEDITVEGEQVCVTEDGGEYVYTVFKAADPDGNELWTAETEHVLATELVPFQAIGVFNGLFLYAGPGVTALDVMSGETVWQNGDFEGQSAVFGYLTGDGPIYLAGYYGPDFYAVDLEGNTLCLIETLSDECWWPSGIRIDGQAGDEGTAYVAFEGSDDGEMREIGVSLKDYSMITEEE